MVAGEEKRAEEDLNWDLEKLSRTSSSMIPHNFRLFLPFLINQNHQYFCCVH
jgi:hypothetical protein